MKRLSTHDDTNVRWKISWRSRPEFDDGFVHSFDVSLHNVRCEGRFLKCVLDVFSGRSRVEISLGDALQRYNYENYGHPSLGVLDRASALEVAIEEGNKWIERNCCVIADVFPRREPKIVRWSNWLRDERVEFYKEHLQSLIRRRRELSLALEEDVVRYERFRGIDDRRPGSAGFGEYVVEEVAVYAAQAEQDLCVHIYPGAYLNFLRALRDCEYALPCVRYLDHIYLYIRE